MHAPKGRGSHITETGAIAGSSLYILSSTCVLLSVFICFCTGWMSRQCGFGRWCTEPVSTGDLNKGHDLPGGLHG